MSTCKWCSDKVYGGGFRGEEQFCDSACAMLSHNVDDDQVTKLQEAIQKGMDERVEPPIPKRWKHLKRVK